MAHRKRIWIEKNKGVNVRIYEDCLAIEDNDSGRAYVKYKHIMTKLQAKEKLESEEEYLNLTTE